MASSLTRPQLSLSLLLILTREARPGGARGVMGRRKEGRRLADPVFKMADVLMADGGEILNLENRPFHRAYLSGKLPCPRVQCRTELGQAFFEQAGLVQHFRANHVGIRYDEQFEREAWRLYAQQGDKKIT